MKEIFIELLGLMKRNRRSGTTTILKNIVANNPKIWVLTESMNSAKEWGFDKSGRGVALSILSTASKHMGYEAMPVLVDNGALISVLEKGLQYVEANEEIQAKKDAEIKTLEKDLAQSKLQADYNFNLNLEHAHKAILFQKQMVKYVHSVVKLLEDEGYDYLMLPTEEEGFHPEVIKFLKEARESYGK